VLIPAETIAMATVTLWNTLLYWCRMCVEKTFTGSVALLDTIWLINTTVLQV